MEMEQAKKERVKFFIERDGFLAETAVILMALSAVFRFIGCWGLWNDRTFALTQVVLPVCCSLLFVMCILFLSKKGFFLSSIPVIFGAVFFIIKSLSCGSWIHIALCILIYIAAAVLYTGTVFGKIRTKWLLAALFALAFLYRIFVEDLAAMRDAANPVTLTDGLREISVLCMILAVFCTALALKKKRPEIAPELPKIKDPVVIVPASAADAETAVSDTGTEISAHSPVILEEEKKEETREEKTGGEETKEDTAGDTL